MTGALDRLEDCFLFRFASANPFPVAREKVNGVIDCDSKADGKDERPGRLEKPTEGSENSVAYDKGQAVYENRKEGN